MKRLLLGNEAIALAAYDSGVKVASGYPGTPSTEVIEYLSLYNKSKNINIEWSVNEKVAVEVAAGASYAGVRVLVTMKQVGLNVASDPVMCLSYVGIKGGMVIYVADDPGPLSSQTEQDTRAFAKYSNLPCFDASTPQDAYDMTSAAFELSEKIKLPVILRATTRVCHSRGLVTTKENISKYDVEGFKKNPKWVIFPKLAYENRIKLEEIKTRLSEIFSSSVFNAVYNEDIKSETGILTGGISFSYVMEALKQTGLELPVLKLGTVNPFPKDFVKSFLKDKKKLLVVEELYPHNEEQIKVLCHENGILLDIIGKSVFPKAGEYSVKSVCTALEKLINTNLSFYIEETPLLLPQRPPVLCAGCPHRASFYAAKKALKGKKAVFSGDIGCYTLGNAKPLDAVDTCLCMGAGITIAQGLQKAQPDQKHLSFIGDSTFFHTGIPGIINAVYNKTDITVIVLDNRTTAMTGHQPHPGTGITMMGENSPHISIPDIIKACGVKHVSVVDPLNHKLAVEKITEAVNFNGPSAVIFESPCVLLKPATSAYCIKDSCTNCKACINQIGCPALTLENGRVNIDQTHCRGCGLCAAICPNKSIVSISKEGVLSEC